jgi:hypothetical protein
MENRKQREEELINTITATHTQVTTTELSLLLAMAVEEAVEWVNKKGARLAKPSD